MAFLGSIGKFVGQTLQQVTSSPLKAATLIAAGPAAAIVGGKIETAVKGLINPQKNSVQAVLAAQDVPQVQGVTQPYFPQQGASPIYYYPSPYASPQQSIYGGPQWDYLTPPQTSFPATGPASPETFSERAISEYLSQRVW